MKHNPSPHPETQAHRRGITIRKMIVVGALLLVPVAVGVAALSVKFPFGKSAVSDLLTDTVKRGPLEILVTEYGSLDSANNVTLYSEVEGSTTIIKIVDEGAKVEKGQVVVELDSSKQRDLLVQQEITYGNAVAATKQGEENLKIQETQNESDRAAAKLKYDLAVLDKNQLHKGDAVNTKAALQGTIALAQEAVTRADETLDFVRRNNKKGYVNQNDVETARIAQKKANYDLEVAKNNLDLYEKYTYERLKAEKDENEREFKREIERTELKGSAALAQARATLNAAKLTRDAEESKLKKLKDQIAACTIRAPQAGEVVYANQQNRDRRGASDTGIMEGAMVREHQAIINLPDLTQARVSTKIHESRIGWVRTGLPVVVRVDALPGEVYYGEVENISTVPISGNWRTPDLKEYTASISVKDPNIDRIRKLKPGLTAQAEIHVDRVENALMVPVQAVAERGGKHYVFVIEDGTPVKKEVQIGKTNDIQIQLLEPASQVKEGNEIVLNPRSLMPKETEHPDTDRTRGVIIKKQGEKDKNAPDGKKKGTDSPGNGGGPPGQMAAAGGSPGQGPANNGGAGEEGDRPRRNREGGGEGGSGPGGAERGPGGGGQGGGGGGRARTPQERFARFDKNGDGKITQDELPEMMQGNFAQYDTNKDGALDLQEISKIQRPGGGGMGGGRGMGGGGGEAGAGGAGGRGEGGGRRRNAEEAGAG